MSGTGRGGHRASLLPGGDYSLYLRIPSIVLGLRSAQEMLWVDESVHELTGIVGVCVGGVWGPLLWVSVLVSWLSVVQDEMSPGLVGSSPTLAVCPGQVACTLWASVSCATKQGCWARVFSLL